MSKLNTDTKRKEFWKKFGMLGWQHKVWNSTDEIWNWIDQALQQAYQKGREEERERIIGEIISHFQQNGNRDARVMKSGIKYLEQLKNTK